MKTIPNRKTRLIRDTIRYGTVALLLVAATVALWFYARQVGIAFLVVACVFCAGTILNFALSFRMYRSFTAMAASEAVPYAFVNEFGHLELCGGTADAVRKYAVFSAAAYAAMYRPVGTKPSADDIKTAKAQRKSNAKKEKQLAEGLVPHRQFDGFTAADLPFLRGKTIFISERMYYGAASEADWQATRANNTLEIIHSPEPGRAGKNKQV